MYAQSFSGTVHGIEGMMVTVETDISNGLPQFDIVGLGGSAIKEARDRVRAALRNGGFTFPMQRITINLAPANYRKEGSGFDLAIAIGILLASEQIRPRSEKTLVAGELALDGSIRPIPGILPILLAAKAQGFTHVLLPYVNREEAWLADMEILPAQNLKEAIEYWNKEKGVPIQERIVKSKIKVTEHGIAGTSDFADVVGQAHVKRGLEVAASGFHNVLLIGPPGSGKTLLATCLPGIMPDMTMEESFEVTKIYSISGHLTNKKGLITKRPIRSPHHTITQAALIGGGTQMPRPGECSLAHGGILFLDEMGEFSRHVLEVLRQPLESGVVTISRAKQVYTYPARFLLVGSMNPCPCGYFGSRDQRDCSCTPSQIQRYRSKLSGPLLDRIDIHLEVPRVSIEQLTERSKAESSQEIRKRVELARQIQTERYSKTISFPFNSYMNSGEVRKYVKVDKEGRELMQVAFEKLGLSARAYDRILKVARTIADLEGSEKICSIHVAEAIRYRALDRTV